MRSPVAIENGPTSSRRPAARAGRLRPEEVEHDDPDRQEPEHQVRAAPARRALHQHDPHPGDGRGPGGQLGAPGHADGAWPRWPTTSGSTSCASIPQDPIWPNRDRFVLSAGHASMLLYSLLHLTGVKAVSKDYEPLGEPSVPLDEIKQFRQLDSRCPGHPEYRWTSGVETTTGPLGQGAGQQRRHGDRPAAGWPRTTTGPASRLFDFNVYALCGDGCMMEGISTEAASLAGHLKLSNLCWIYDNNHITIEGNTALAFTEDVATRFLGYGWNVTRVGDANDLDHARARLRRLPDDTNDRPTLIIVDSHIGYGAPHKQDTSAAHGEPLGEEEIRLDQAELRLARGRQVPRPRRRLRALPARASASAARSCATPGSTGSSSTRPSIPSWPTSSTGCSTASSPTAGTRTCPPSPPTPRGWPTRDSSGKVLNALAKNVPWLIGGAADLAPSTKTRLTFDGAGDFEADNYGGRNFHFGIREHAMGAILNGMALVKVRPFGSGFLIFSDYGRPPIRLAAIMEIPVIYVFTHDSIGVGEDGPTHQPIEQLASLRAIPGLIVLRPRDANEVVEAWQVIMQLHHEPAVLVLTRQALPTLDRDQVRPGLRAGARAPTSWPTRPAASPT